MHISVFGVDTHYQKMGNGAPLVLLHGWGCTWEIWYPIIAELSKKYQLIIPDLPAFGESKLHSNEWNSFHYAEWLQAFVSKVIGKRKLYIVGHSFGGKIAALYAARFQPTQLQHLFLVDISGVPNELAVSQKIQEAVLRLVPPRVKQRIPRAIINRLLQRVGAEDYQQATTQQREIFKLVVKENILQVVKEIKVATTLFWGEKDLDTPFTSAQALAAAIPNAQLVVFPGAGHFPFLEQPSVFLKELSKVV